MPNDLSYATSEFSVFPHGHVLLHHDSHLVPLLVVHLEGLAGELVVQHLQQHLFVFIILFINIP